MELLTPHVLHAQQREARLRLLWSAGHLPEGMERLRLGPVDEDEEGGEPQGQEQTQEPGHLPLLTTPLRAALAAVTVSRARGSQGWFFSLPPGFRLLSRHFTSSQSNALLSSLR